MKDLNDVFHPMALKTSIIQINSYQEKNFEGVLLSSHNGEKKSFSNLTQLLLFVEAMQDSLQCTQRYMEPRSFTHQPTPSIQLPPVDILPSGGLATFQIQLLFRQNASWQGTVIWIEQKLEAQFRSALELVTLMDSVLSS